MLPLQYAPLRHYHDVASNDSPKEGSIMAKKRKNYSNVTELRVGRIVLGISDNIKYEYPFSIPFHNRRDFKMLQDALKRGTLEILELKQR